MAAFAGPFFGRIACQLDLDESEARTRLSIARLARVNGDLARAAVLESEAEFYTRTEAECLPRFDRIFVSSEPERQYLLDRHPQLAVKVLPNSVALPSCPTSHAVRAVPVLLFAGNLGYYPNADAVRYLLTEIVPLVKAQARMEFQVRIAGRGASRALQETIAREPTARWLGFVPDLASEYWQASVAVVPLRAGGGTRIKILEAFAHRVPVVSTTIGAEGLDARPGEHLLVEDSAEGLAACCVRLLQDAALGRSLAAQGYQLVAERYSSDALSVPD